MSHAIPWGDSRDVRRLRASIALASGMAKP